MLFSIKSLNMSQALKEFENLTSFSETLKSPHPSSTTSGFFFIDFKTFIVSKIYFSVNSFL